MKKILLVSLFSLFLIGCGSKDVADMVNSRYPDCRAVEIHHLGEKKYEVHMQCEGEKDRIVLRIRLKD